MADDLRAKIAEMFMCRCDPAWTERNLHAPDCIEGLGEDVLEAVAEWLRAEAERVNRTYELGQDDAEIGAVVNHLDHLAHSLTQPSTEEKR